MQENDDNAASQIQAELEKLKLNPSRFPLKTKAVLEKYGGLAVEGVIGWLSDSDNTEEIRAYAAYFLGKLNDTRGVKPLVEVGLADKSYMVRNWTADALAKFRDIATIPALLNALIGEDSTVLKQVARALVTLEVEGEAISLILDHISHVKLSEPAIASAFGALACFELTQPQHLQKLLDFYQAGYSSSGNAVRTFASNILLSTEYYAYVLDDHLKILEEEYSIQKRESLIGRLGRIRDERVVVALVKCLEDRSANIRCTAAYILGEMGAISASALEPLAKLRKWDIFAQSFATGDNAGILATEAIRQIRWELDGESARLEELSSDELILQLSSDDWLVREGAAQLLGERGGSQAAAALIQALTCEQDTTVLSAIAEALELLKDERAFTPLLTELKRYNPITVWPVARALGALGNELAIEPLALGLVYAPQIDGDAFMAGLTRFGEKIIPYILKMLKAADNLTRKAAAQISYQYRENEEVFEALLSAFNDPTSSTHVRVQIASTLRHVEHTYPVDYLLGLLEEPNEKIKEFTIQNLGRSGNQQVVGRLLDLIPYTVLSDWGKVELIAALEKLGGALAITGIIQLLKNYSPQIRERAIQALGKLKSSQAVPALVDIVENGNSQERYLAIESLAQIGDEAALPALEYASMYDKGIHQYTGERLKNAAAKAICSIKANHR